MEAKIISLIESLNTKTQNKEANWERIGKSDQFVLTLGNGKVSVNKVITKDSVVVYQFAIFNAKSDTIFNVNAIKGNTILSSSDYELLKTIHESIKKMYFKVDETIDGLLGEINKEGDIGKEPEDLPF